MRVKKRIETRLRSQPVQSSTSSTGSATGRSASTNSSSRNFIRSADPAIARGFVKLGQFQLRDPDRVLVSHALAISRAMSPSIASLTPRRPMNRRRRST